MLIHRILYPIISLGPGSRLVIWTQGCSKKCPGCISPEMQRFDGGFRIPAKQLIEQIREGLGDTVPDGVTISGGDPFEQPEELLELLQGLQTVSEDILIYTGYRYSELQKLFGEEYLSQIKRFAAVLIDGRYIDGLNDNRCPLRGSTNQQLLYLKESYRDRYERFCAQGRIVENIYDGAGRLITVGILNKEKE